MIFSQIRPWGHADISPQIATFWEISTNKEFTNIIETQTTTGDSLYFLQSNITVPSLSTYYIRATRKFANADSDITLEPKEVSNIDTVISNNIIHRDSVHIDKPFITINMTEFLNPDFPDFEVKTSKFRCKQDGHVATNWIITDLNNNIVYKSLYDQYDKVLKRFDKTAELLNKTNLIFYVSHVSTNGMESEYAKYILVNDNFNFEVKGLFTDIPPYQDLDLYIEPLEALTKDISSIWIKKVNETGDVVRSVPITITTGSNKITIPGEELSYNSKFYLDIYAINRSEETSFKRYVLKVQSSGYSGTLIEHKYKKEIFTYPEDKYKNIVVPNAFYTTELSNGNILLANKVSNRNPKIIKTIYRSTQDGPLIELDFKDYGVQQDITLSSELVDNVFYKILNNNILLIENSKVINQQPKPSFKVYSYDPIKNIFTLQHETTREDETSPIAVQNSAIQISEDKIWYMPIGTGVIKEYNFLTNQIKTVLDLNDNYNTGSMFYNRKVGKLILFNSKGNGFTVDVNSLTITESKDVPFREWVGQRLKAVELLNGDVLIINQNDMTKTNSLVYYDSAENTYTELYTESHDIHHIGVIQTRTPHVYIINKENSGEQRFLVSRLV